MSLIIHFHDGLFSFVLWLKAPYDLIDEHNHPIVRNATGIKKLEHFIISDLIWQQALILI